MSALLCAAAIFAAACHNNNQNSGAGYVWVSLTDQPGDFTSYIVNVDSIALTRTDGAVATVAGGSSPETVDFTKLNDISELWAGTPIQVGTYTSASIVLDYTNAVISVMVGGVPQTSVAYTYGTAGQLASVTDVLGNQFRWVYDVAGRPDTLYFPGSIWQHWTYDADSRVSERVEHASQYIGTDSGFASTVFRDDQFRYDARGKMAKVTESLIGPQGQIGEMVFSGR